MSPEELLKACVQRGDTGAWEEFVRRYRPVIARTVLRVARRWGRPEPQRIDDLIQDTFLKLCADDARRLRDFVVLHAYSVEAYLQTVANHVTLDHFRREMAQVRDVNKNLELTEEIEPAERCSEAGLLSPMELNVFRSEVEQALKHCAKGPHQERNIAIFWFRHTQGMSPAEISRLPHITLKTKGIDTLVSRLLRCVRERLTS
jgi:RNA polymerase sigma-70 factor (ECF subfamily)